MSFTVLSYNDGTSSMRLGECVAGLTLGDEWHKDRHFGRWHYLGTTCVRDETDTTSRVTVHDLCVKSVQGEFCMLVTKSRTWQSGDIHCQHFILGIRWVQSAELFANISLGWWVGSALACVCELLYCISFLNCICSIVDFGDFQHGGLFK